MVMNHYRTASGRGGMVMNHYDSAFNRHPNPARGCAESVNWNLKGALNPMECGFVKSAVARTTGNRCARSTAARAQRAKTLPPRGGWLARVALPVPPYPRAQPWGSSESATPDPALI